LPAGPARDGDRLALSALVGRDDLIAGPDQGGTHGRTHPAEAQKVRYLVHGIDPLYVYRQEDFDLLNHWDHMMLGKEASQDGDETPDPIPDQPAEPELSGA
jgi:hypothetical protein